MRNDSDVVCGRVCVLSPGTRPETREHPGPLGSGQANDMAATRTIQGYLLDSREGLFCETCTAWSVTSVAVAVVDGESLEMIGRYFDTVCESCGAETFHR